MQVRPNKTLIRAIFRSYEPAADGLGGEVSLADVHNETPSRNEDFIRPSKGAALTAYIAERPAVEAGAQVTVELKLMGGPGGGRILIQSIVAGAPKP